MSYRPTTLQLFDRHCPRALDFYESGAPRDEAPFTSGIACHAIIQAVGEATNKAGCELPDKKIERVGRAVAEALIRDGRSFEGRQEPPLNPSLVWGGYEAAMDYLARHPLEPGARYEIGLGVDEKWRPAKYGECWLGHIFDRVELRDTEAGGVSLVITDLKGWQPLAAEMESIQRKVAATVAWRHFAAEATSLEIVVASYRTGAEKSRKLWPHDGEDEVLAEWRAEIEATVQAIKDSRQLDGRRRARPGGGCVGCPYLARCEDAQDYRERSSAILEAGAATEQAKAYALAVADVGELRDALKPLVEDEPIEVSGYRVGYIAQPTREVNPAHFDDIAAEWEKDGGDLSGFIAACGLSVTGLERVARVLFPESKQAKERRTWAQQFIHAPAGRAMFKVVKT